MKKAFLISSLGCTEEINGNHISKKIDDTNNVISLLKENIEKYDNFVFICSSPNTYEKNDLYSKLTFESFAKSGLKFKNLIVIDDRYKGNLKEEIKNADIIHLAGGHTLTEIKFFEEINLREYLKEYKKVIVGQSAGALNLAEKVVCAPEYIEEIGTSYVWNGLGLTNANIEPHFIIEKLTDKNEILLREELLKLSEEYKIYALIDGSYIYDNGITKTLYGEGYLIENKNIKKICNNKEKILL